MKEDKNMKITKEIGSLKEFSFWGPAVYRFNLLTDEEIAILDAIYEEIEWTPTETELNDKFAYYFSDICDLLNLDEEEVLNRG